MANIIEILMNMKGSEQVQKKLGGVTKSMKSAGAAAAKYTAGIGILVAGATKLVEIHGVQQRAEDQLEKALGKTSKALLNQASALQKSSRFGDEAIIQQQAFLASLNFTEKEIKQMIPAALDLAEATGMDLGSAVKNMAKTFSGMQGELGELIPQMKDLTQEELKAGGAVGLINDLFGGQAEVAAQATAGIDQMKMTMGDLAEIAGSKLAPILNTVGLAFSNILSGAPGSEWWEGVEIGMEGAVRQSQALSMQIGGIDRLIGSFQELSDSELKEAFAALGVEYDAMSSRVENINFLELTQAKRVRELIEVKAEEKEVLIEEQEILAQTTQKWVDLNSEVRKHSSEVIPFQLKAAKKFDKSLMGTGDVTNDLTTDYQRFEKASTNAFEGAANAANAAADIIAATAGDDKRRQILAMRISQIAAIANTAQGVTKALAASPPPFNFIAAAATGAAGALQIAGIETAIGQARSAATGLDEVFSQPTALIVGDTREGERVSVTPEGGDDSIVPTIVLQFNSPVTSSEFIRNELIPEIREAMRLGL
jgi:hypothetical protein